MSNVIQFCLGRRICTDLSIPLVEYLRNLLVFLHKCVVADQYLNALVNFLHLSADFPNLAADQRAKNYLCGSV